MKWSLTLLSLLVAAMPAQAGSKRSPWVPKQFQYTHPCPSTGRTTGPCPGYVRDHVIPLACGGSDSTMNMQWQTTEAGKDKDRWELGICGKRNTHVK